MTAPIHQKKLIVILIMLFALAGMMFSVIGEAISHGVTELNMPVPVDQDDHSHSHDSFNEKPGTHLHHDASNHSHESVDQLTFRLISDYALTLQQFIPCARNTPRNFHYPLYRPPKVAHII